jgi:sugar lactone lactonase YvrE
VPRALPLTDPVAYHGEGPVWFAERQELRWVDMLAGDVLIRGRGGTVEWQAFDTPVVAALRPRTNGGCIMALEHGFALQRDLDSVALDRFPTLIDDPSVRLNEGGCDPDGRFYCGSMAYDAHKDAGALYRLDLDSTVETVLTEVTISNGLEWTPDGSLAYYVDTPTHQIDVFDYDSERGLTGRRRFVAIDPELGQPDGLTVDSDGCVWVALWNGSAVRRYRPDGTLDEVVEVDARNVTACTIGGANSDELFITTSRQHAPDDPLAGALFHLAIGVKGQPVRPFRG